MKSVAVCVVTYEHPETVDDVLEQSIQRYYDAGIDIYYYDASEDDRTQQVVRKYQELGFDNLHYLSLTGTPPVDRLEMCFRGEGLQDEYEYILPCKDRSFASEEALNLIAKCMEEKEDVILIGGEDNCEPQIKIYNDAELFYRDWAWLATSIDVLIYRKESILKNFMGWQLPIIFNVLYRFLFQRLPQMDTTRICVILGKGVFMQNSNLAQSVWKKLFLRYGKMIGLR